VDEQADGSAGFVESVVSFDGVGGGGHAVPQVLVEEHEGHAVEGLGRRRELDQDVRAGGLAVNLPLQPADLTFDPVETTDEGALVCDVAL
jgi:hypothetical protein